MNVGDVTLHLGDALDLLPTLAAASVDAVVTDPPAGIAFMGKEWDTPNTFPLRDRGPLPARQHGRGFANGMTYDRSHKGRRAFIAFLTAVMTECLRVARPGAYALVWALPRTSHWTGTATEDAGWVIADVVTHLFGQGFPKHRSKLKPAAEFWYLCWKPDRRATPLPGLDACRIGHSDDLSRYERSATSGFKDGGVYGDGGSCLTPAHPAGRYPANLVLSHSESCRLVGARKVKGSNPIGPNPGKLGYHGARQSSPSFDYTDADGLEEVEEWCCSEDCPVAELDRQSGTSKSSGGVNSHGLTGNVYGDHAGRNGHRDQGGPGDVGGASRFFYCSKASKRDRGPGNTHPTVKPQALMRWLCRLITPLGGTVLDPFAGSGSTGVACIAEGFGFVGIEKEPEYHAIATRRLAAAQPPLAVPSVPTLFAESAP